MKNKVIKILSVAIAVALIAGEELLFSCLKKTAGSITEYSSEMGPMGLLPVIVLVGMAVPILFGIVYFCRIIADSGLK